MKSWVSGSSTGNTLRMRLYSCRSTVTDRVEVGEMHRSARKRSISKLFGKT